jgi:hypothetical protein
MYPPCFSVSILTHPWRAGATVVYPIVGSDVKWLLPVHSVERFVGDACAFPVNTGSVCRVFFADHATVYTAPTSLALEVRIRFTGSVIIVVALLRMSLAVDAPSYCHWCLALLESGERGTPRCTGGRTTLQRQAASVYPIVDSDVKWSGSFTQRGVLHSPLLGGETMRLSCFSIPHRRQRCQVRLQVYCGINSP